MPVFLCDKCKMMENTATSRYWTRGKDEPALCTLCDPKFAKWHDCFDRKPLPKECVIGPDGFVYHQDDPYLKKQLAERKEVKEHESGKG